MGGGRAPCCDKSKVKRGPWSPAEDLKLINFIHTHGHPNWRALPKQAGLLRCGKSCRLRWINYLRPDVKRGNFTPQEEETIIQLHQSLGNKWSKIASHFPGRTDNEIKNVWNTHLKKKLIKKTDDNHHSHYKDEETKESSMTDSSSSTSFISYEDQNLEKTNNNPTNNEQPKTSTTTTSSSTICFDDIPLESDLDFWNMLDNLDSNAREFEASESSSFNMNGDQEISREVDECNKWLRKLENELGLVGTAGENPDQHQSDEFVEETDDLIMKKAEDIDHMDYFALWPSSPQNFAI